MKEQLKARFFGMYLGCEMIYDDKRLTLDGMDYSFSGLEIVGCRSVENGLEQYRGISMNDCKLILRPLSDITDMEVLEAFNAAGIYGFDVLRDESKIGVVGRNGVSAVIWIKTSPLPIGRFLEAWNNFPDNPQPECFEYMLADYLRSRNFCLPFMGLDPVAEGWAILEPKNLGL